MLDPRATQRGLRHYPNEKNVNKGHLGLFSQSQYESRSLREPHTRLAFRPEGRKLTASGQQRPSMGDSPSWQ